jgi:hypothetical protein
VNIIEHHDQVKGLQNKELHIIRKWLQYRANWICSQISLLDILINI